MSGGLDDGTAGLWAIKSRGGVAIVQDLLDAIAPDMPRSAPRHVAVDHCVPPRSIADLIVRLGNETVDEQEAQPVSRLMSTKVRVAQQDNTQKATSPT